MTFDELVAPYAGAGIEIEGYSSNTSRLSSPPTRGRELKLLSIMSVVCVIIVAPYAGAGIEILGSWTACRQNRVAPYAGAGIEISRREDSGF